MRFSFFIAKRHLFSQHKIGYISFISIISIIGLSLGVAALILTISILNGFEQEVKSKLIDFDAHIRLRLFYQESMDTTSKVDSTLNSIGEIKYIAPYIHRSVMIRHGNETEGVVLEGISEKDIHNTLRIDRFLSKGKIDFSEENKYSGIVIGKKLAEKLNVDIDDKVYLFILHGSQGIGSRPKIGKFRLTGIYDSGIADYDDIFVYTGLKSAQRIYELDNTFSGYQILLSNPLNADKIATQINKELGFPYHAMSWNDLHSNLFRWLEVQRLPIIIVFGLIALVAIFNIISSLMMIVLEKTKDIGILKSMGVNNSQITGIFMIEGGLIGIAGTLLGFLVAIFLSWIQMKFSVISIPEDVYFMSKLPVLLNWKDFLYIGIGTLIFSLIATFYPAIKSKKLLPGEATRYE